MCDGPLLDGSVNKIGRHINQYRFPAAISARLALGLCSAKTEFVTSIFDSTLNSGLVHN